jgi:serine/threonine-protein kinase
MLAGHVDLQPGSRFDRYVIESLLGQGGMGRVYRAQDERLQRAVALKVLRLDGSVERDPSVGAERLLREARAAASLEHINTIAIHDVGEFEGVPFIAMELVVGQSLRAYVGNDAVPIETRVRYLVDVARALAAAHAQGIVHRDVKPENVIVRSDGVVKVLDFGIARPLRAPADAKGGGLGGVPLSAFAADTWAKESGLSGTPRYMAPEQLCGETLDARADQFSWGVLAYELLTGHTPWPETAAVSLTFVLAIVDDTRVDDAPLRRVCPPQVADVVLRALSKARADRFGSMSEIVEALAGAPSTPSLPEGVTDGAAQSTAAPTTAPTTKKLARRRAPWALGLVAAVVALGGAGLVARQRGLHPEAEVASSRPSVAPVAPPAPPAGIALEIDNPRRVTLDEGCEEFPSFTPDGASMVYAAESGENEHVLVQSLGDGNVRALTHGPGWDLAPTISPDGRLVAFLHSDDKELATYVADFDGHDPPRRIAAGGTRPTFSPDGTAVWAGSKQHPTRRDLASNEATRTLDSPLNCGGPLLRELPGGRVVVTYPAADLATDAGIALFSATGAMTWLARVDSEEVLAVSPGGGYVLGARTSRTGNTELFSVPMVGGPWTAMPSSDLRPFKGMSFSPDGTKIAWSACRGIWSLGRFDDKGAFVPSGSTSWQESSVAPIPGSRAIAVISQRSGSPGLWVLDPSGHDAPRLVHAGSGDGSLGENVDVSPDASLAALEISGGGIALVRMSDGTVRPLTTDASDERPYFTRDGRQVIFTRRTAESGLQVHVANVDDGQIRTLLEPGSRQAAPSPVDERIAYITGEAPGSLIPMVADLGTGKKHPLSPKLGAGRYMSVAFSPNGKRIAVVVGEGRVAEVDASSGAIVRQGDGGDQLQALRYVGDELWAARSAYRGNVWMADVKVTETVH